MKWLAPVKSAREQHKPGDNGRTKEEVLLDTDHDMHEHDRHLCPGPILLQYQLHHNMAFDMAWHCLTVRCKCKTKIRPPPLMTEGECTMLRASMTPRTNTVMTVEITVQRPMAMSGNVRIVMKAGGSGNYFLTNRLLPKLAFFSWSQSSR